MQTISTKCYKFSASRNSFQHNTNANLGCLRFYFSVTLSWIKGYPWIIPRLKQLSHGQLQIMYRRFEAFMDSHRSIGNSYTTSAQSWHPSPTVCVKVSFYGRLKQHRRSKSLKRSLQPRLSSCFWTSTVSLNFIVMLLKLALVQFSARINGR